ncbi:hypothetical protein BH11MYX3_BH11MYX3_13980 [soil metagenome]
MTRLRCLVLAITACSGRSAAPPSTIEPLPPVEVPIHLGREPIVNPLNLWDLLIDGPTELDLVGVIAGERITTRVLDDRSGQVLTRIGDRIYEARDAGWRWLVEREGLRRVAGGTSIAALLAEQTARLPLPDDAALAPYLRREDVTALPADDARAAALSLWRWDAWRIRRSVLVTRGLDGVTVNRRQLMLIKRELTTPDAVVGDLGDRAITRRELHLAAGYPEQVARREYVEAARAAFDDLTRERLLVGAKLPATPAPTEPEVDAFIAQHPEYRSAENGRGRARADISTLRAAAARDEQLARLAVERGVRFDLRPSPFEAISPDVDAPRAGGTAGAPHTLEILHCVGTATCAIGTELVAGILRALGDRVRLVAGDYFEQPRLTTLRGALALRCAEDQGRGWALALALSRGTPAASVTDLDARAVAAGVEPTAFRACMASDRWIPTVFENVARAQVLGLEMNMIGIWVDGMRIESLSDPAAAAAEALSRFSQ